jgi:hypothetical protein
VTVRNAAPTPASATATVTITVLDVNEPPTTPATSVRAVDENSAVGTAVGSALTASDVDARDQGVGRLTFTLLTTGSPFALDPVSGLLTVASAVLDYEAQGSYTLTYRVSDSAWEALRGNLTADGTVFVDINNRNDQPSLADVSASVDENGAGLSVATLRATDQDAGQGMVYTLSRTSSVCWAYSITAAQATSFSSGGGAGVAVVPVALPAVSAGALQTVVFRFRGSGSVRIVLSATATLSSSDRYEITYTRTSTEVKRIFASGTTTTVLTTATEPPPHINHGVGAPGRHHRPHGQEALPRDAPEQQTLRGHHDADDPRRVGVDAADNRARRRDGLGRRRRRVERLLRQRAHVILRRRLLLGRSDDGRGPRL